ncbi:hypothetical protein DPMN_192216 [Dreissena polymorpha]|uniref:Uncharacterized protein n=1 Tax=Dreissena polymorpha TaxID=45954 RepID=A0A9D3Y0R6_DREPO|nr:hypothetical protein DPMN_192216 [Dreissena polymorpha]
MAIEKKQLRFYMIPERNLMEACGLDDALQQKWVADITNVMEEGPWLILRLEKIRKAIVASPEPMLWLSKQRMKLEMLYMVLANRVFQCTDENLELNDSDCALKEIRRRIMEILKDVGQRMHQEGSPVFQFDPFDLLKRLLM